MQVQKSVRLDFVRFIALAFALLVALLLASAAGYVIRGGAPTDVVAQQPLAHEQPPDSVTLNQALQKAKGIKGPDALERDQRLLANR